MNLTHFGSKSVNVTTPFNRSIPVIMPLDKALRHIIGLSRFAVGHVPAAF